MDIPSMNISRTSKKKMVTIGKKGEYYER